MFKIQSAYQPTGDQPQAIEALTQGILQGQRAQTLLGVTGSGKTFTIANVVEKIQKPTLVLSHNKTLAAQLYNEFKSFFPDNAVEYFVSYYDYYQPEAYIPTTNTYIEKDLSINQEIEKLRLSATSALLSGRKDVLVVSSAIALLRVLVVNQRVVERIYVTRCLPDSRVHEDSRVDADNIFVQEHHALPPVLLDVVFQFHTHLRIIIYCAEAIINFA